MLNDREKAILKKYKVERIWVNWLPGVLVYAGVSVRAYLWRSFALFQYLDIIYKGWSYFTGTSWLQYDEEF